MRIIRHLLVLAGVGVVALAGYHVAASAQTYVASLEPRASSRDLTSRWPQIGRGAYTLADLAALEPSVQQVASRYVDPRRIDYQKMFAAGLEAVEHQCPEVLLRLEGERLHVQVDRFSTVLTVAELDSEDDVVEQARRVAQILETQLPKGSYTLPEIEYAFTNGMLSTLDPHTILLPPEAAKKMQEDNDGSFGGLGISIKMQNGELTIDYPMMGTPAWKAGLKPDDKIVKIEGEGTFNMDIEEAVSKMRGPAGTHVTITIMREGFDLPRDVKLQRAEIKPEAVWGELLDGNVGYVQLSSFHQMVDSQLDAELTALSRKAGAGGLKGLVIDMRDNPGGYLDQATKVVDKFLNSGVIVATVGPPGVEREEKKAVASGTEPAYPIVVLMSGNSASASEIVAGALKNTERAVILGERSFGKGSVQELMDLPDGARLKLTVRQYLTPGDHSIQEIGIPPDIELKRSYVSPPRELKEYGVMSGPRISLFARDHILREADLSGHLQNSVNLETPPVYSLRYLAQDPADIVQKSDRRDVRSDFEVMLARDVLLAAHGPRRADVLVAAEKVVATRSSKQAQSITQAFGQQGIDWSECENPEAASAELDLGFVPLGAANETDRLEAGKLTLLRATVRNTGDRPLCQALVRSASPNGNDVLDGIEFYLGRIEPGATRSYETRAMIPGGYPSEVAQVRLDLVDMSQRVLASSTVDVATESAPLPEYAWSWTLDDKSGGDGDGLVEVGETIQLNYTLKNSGQGPGGDVTFNLRKLPGMGKAVELKEARFEAKGLAAGASHAGILSFRVVSEPADPKMGFELSVRDNTRYDYAAISRAGLYAYSVATEQLDFTLGQAAEGKLRQPPRIEVTRAPTLQAGEESITLSGVATDEVGVRDVIVYQGTRKLAYVGGGGSATPLPTVPFTATAELTEGNNVIVVTTRDVDGFTATRSFDVLRRPTVAAAPTSGAIMPPTARPSGG